MYYITGCFSIILFYLCGAFPSGYLIGKLHGITIWQHGSGNIGATNVSRVLGKRAGAFTLLIDILKGFIPLSIAGIFGATNSNLGCLATFLILGHCVSLPPYLKGGKGVATSLGVLLALSPLLAITSSVIFALTFMRWRIVSLSSISAALTLPIAALLYPTPNHEQLVHWLALIAFIVCARHRANIQRLIQGQEPQFSFGKKAES